MTKFRFRLDRLLELRAKSERERAQMLGAALRAEQERATTLAHAHAHLERVGGQIELQARGTQPAGTLHLLRLATEAAARHIEHAEASHRDATAQVEEEQTRFREARSERRVVERLRERRAAAWQTDVSRAEQKDLDDVAQRGRRGGEPQ